MKRSFGYGYNLSKRESKGSLLSGMETDVRLRGRVLVVIMMNKDARFMLKLICFGIVFTILCESGYWILALIVI